MADDESLLPQTTAPSRAETYLNQWRHSLSTSLSLKTSLLSELSGAVGDLGTYIPIVLALTLVSHLDLSTTLIFTAIYNIASGILFGTPMPVQPMKSIAAVAVSEMPHLTVNQIAAAGISTAAVLFLLGVTGLMSFLYRYLPLPVVRGVQLSQVPYCWLLICSIPLLFELSWILENCVLVLVVSYLDELVWSATFDWPHLLVMEGNLSVYWAMDMPKSN